MMNCIFIRRYAPCALLLVVGFCSAQEQNSVFYDGSVQALYNHATTECNKGHYVQGKELFAALAHDERFSQLTGQQQHQLLYNKGNAEFLADDLQSAAATFEDVAHRFDDKKAAQKYAYIKQLLEQKKEQKQSQDENCQSGQNNDKEQQSDQQDGGNSGKNNAQSQNNKQQEQGDSQESDNQEGACDEPHQKDAQHHGKEKKEDLNKTTDTQEHQKNEARSNSGAHKNEARDSKQHGMQQQAVPYKPERPDDKLYAALAERDEQVQKAVIRGLVNADDHNQQERNARGHKTW